MLDPRVYRACFVPLIFALVIAAFSLGNRPPAQTTTLEPDSFDPVRAYGCESTPKARCAVANPPKDSLLELAKSFPNRQPGSQGDLAVADRVEATFKLEGFATRRLRTTAPGPDGDTELTTVVGVRPGVSNRRIVLTAHRDATKPYSAAELSGTAALMELARVAAGTDLDKTLVLVSTSGGTLGSAGAAEFGADASNRVDAVIALGDLASAKPKRPWVLPWSMGRGMAPVALERTLESAVRKETGADPGGVRATSQWMRLAVPIAFGDAAAMGRAGLPAVQLSATGERAPSANAQIDDRVMAKFGRSALRALSAIDASKDTIAGPQDGLLTNRKVLPPWVPRLIVGLLLLPALVASVDAFARARRRHEPAGTWLAWVGLAILPFLLGYGWMRVMALAGVVHAPAGIVEPGIIPFDATGAVIIASTVLVIALGWFGLRPLIRRELIGEQDASRGGAGAAVGLVLSLTGLATWALNPEGAIFLIPAIHGWLLICAGDAPAKWWISIVALITGVLPVLALIGYYDATYSLSIGQTLWAGWLLFAGGGIGPTTAACASVLAGSLGATILVLRARAKVVDRPPDEPLTTRGPLTYAGPGSLGGTESALRR